MPTRMLHNTQPDITEFFPDGTGYASEVDLSHLPQLPRPPAWRCSTNPHGNVVAVLQDSSVAFLHVQRVPSVQVLDKQSCPLTNVSTVLNQRKSNHCWSESGEIFAVSCEDDTIVLFDVSLAPTLHCTLCATIAPQQWPKLSGPLRGVHFYPGRPRALLTLWENGQIFILDLPMDDAPWPPRFASTAQSLGCPKGCSGVQCSVMAREDLGKDAASLQISCKLNATDNGVLSLGLSNGGGGYHMKEISRVKLFAVEEGTAVAGKRNSSIGDMLRGVFAKEVKVMECIEMAVSPMGKRVAVVRRSPGGSLLYLVEVKGSGRSVEIPKGALLDVDWWSDDLAVIGTHDGAIYAVNQALEVFKEAHVENLVSISRGTTAETRLCCITCTSGWSVAPPGRKLLVSHGPHALCRSYMLTFVQESPVDRFIKGRIAEGETEVALTVATEQGIDGELMNKWMWEAAQVKDAELWKQYGSVVKDKEWLTDQVVDCALPTLQDMQAMVETVSAFSERRADLEAFLDTWRTYVSIVGSTEYSPSRFDEFKATAPLELAKGYAEEGEVDAVRVMLRRHGNEAGFVLTECILHLLDCFPDSLSPAAYKDLLPCAALDTDGASGYFVLTSDNEVQPFAARRERDSSSNSLGFIQLCEWYISRACAFDAHSGMLFHTEQLTTLALHRLSVGGMSAEFVQEECYLRLVQLHDDAWMLTTLVYQQQLNTLMTLEEWQTLDLTTRVSLLSQGLTPTTAVNALVQRLVPTYSKLPANSLVTLSWLKALRAFLVSLCREEAGDGIAICAAVIKQSRPIKQAEGGVAKGQRVIPSTQVLIETALACCYANARVDNEALEAMERIFESLPVRLPALEKRLPALARLQDRVELLEIHLRADMVLAKYDAAVPLTFFLDAKRSQDEAELEDLQVVDEEDAPRAEVMSHALMQRRDSRMGDPEMEPDSGKSLLLRVFLSASKAALKAAVVDDALLVRSLVFPYISERYVYLRGLLTLLRGLAFDEAHELLQRESLIDCLQREEIEDAVCAVFQELFNSAADASQMEVALARQTLDVLPFTPSQRVQSERSLLSAVELLHSELVAPMVPLQVKKLLTDNPMSVLDELFKLNPHAFRPPAGSGIPAVGATVLRLAGHLGLRSHEEKLAVNARLVRACVDAGDPAAALAVASRMDTVTEPLPDACFHAFVSIAASELFDPPTRKTFGLRCVDTCAPVHIEEALAVLKELPCGSDEAELIELVKAPVPDVDIPAALEDDTQAIACTVRLIPSLPSVAVLLLGRMLRERASDDAAIVDALAQLKATQVGSSTDETFAERSRAVQLYACAGAVFEDFAVMDMDIASVCSKVQAEVKETDSLSALSNAALDAARSVRLSAECGGLDALLGGMTASELFQSDAALRETALRGAAVSLFEEGALEKEVRVQTLLKTIDDCQVDLFDIAAEWVEATVVSGEKVKRVVDNATKRGKALHAALRAQADKWLVTFCPRIWATLPGNRKDLLFLTCNLTIAFLKFASAPTLEKAVLMKTREVLKRLHALAPPLDAKKVINNPFTLESPSVDDAVEEVIGAATEENVLGMTTLLTNRAAAITPGLDEGLLLVQFISQRLSSPSPPTYNAMKKLLPKLSKEDVVRICRYVAFDVRDAALPLDTAEQLLRDGVRLAGESLLPVLALMNARRAAVDAGAAELAHLLAQAEEEHDKVKATIVGYILAEGSSAEAASAVLTALSSSEEEEADRYDADAVYIAAIEQCLADSGDGLDRLFTVHLSVLDGDKVKTHVAELCSGLHGQHEAKAHALELLEADGRNIDASLLVFHRTMLLVTSFWPNIDLHHQPLTIVEPGDKQAELFDRLEGDMDSAEQHDALFKLLLLLDDSAECPISFSHQARRLSASLVNAILDHNGVVDVAVKWIAGSESRLHARWHKLLLGYPSSTVASAKLIDLLPSNALTEGESLEVLHHFVELSKTLAAEFGFTSSFSSVQNVAQGVAADLAKAGQFPQHLALAVQSCCPPSFLLKHGIPFPELQSLDEAVAFTWSFLYVEAALVCEGHVLAAGRVALQQRHVAARLWSAFSPIACLDHDLKHHVAVVGGENRGSGWERASDLVDRALQILANATSTKRVVSSPTVSTRPFPISSAEANANANANVNGNGNGNDRKKDEAGWESGSDLEVSGSFYENVDQENNSQPLQECVDIAVEDGAWDADSDLELSSHSEGAQVEVEADTEKAVPLQPAAGGWDAEIVFSDEEVADGASPENRIDDTIEKAPMGIVNVDDGWGEDSDIDIDTSPSDNDVPADPLDLLVSEDQHGSGSTQDLGDHQDEVNGSHPVPGPSEVIDGSVLQEAPPVHEEPAPLAATAVDENVSEEAAHEDDEEARVAPSPGSTLNASAEHTVVVSEGSSAQMKQEEPDEQEIGVEALDSVVSTLAVQSAALDADEVGLETEEVAGTGWESDMSFAIDDDTNVDDSQRGASQSDVGNDVAADVSTLTEPVDKDVETDIGCETTANEESSRRLDETNILPAKESSEPTVEGEAVIVDTSSPFAPDVRAESSEAEDAIHAESRSDERVETDIEQQNELIPAVASLIETSLDNAGHMSDPVEPHNEDSAGSSGDGELVNVQESVQVIPVLPTRGTSPELTSQVLGDEANVEEVLKEEMLEPEVDADTDTESVEEKTATTSVREAEEGSVAASLGSDIGHASSIAAVCGEDPDVDSTLGEMVRDNFDAVQSEDLGESPPANIDDTVPSTSVAEDEDVDAAPREDEREVVVAPSKADGGEQGPTDMLTGTAATLTDPPVETIKSSNADDFFAALSSVDEGDPMDVAASVPAELSAEPVVTMQVDSSLEGGNGNQDVTSSTLPEAADEEVVPRLETEPKMEAAPTIAKPKTPPKMKNRVGKGKRRARRTLGAKRVT